MLGGSLQQFLSDLVVTLLLSGLYGYSLSGFAGLLGDRGPAYDGRLTLNPIAHLDLIGTLVLFLLGLGWSKPVRLEPELFGRPRRDSVFVVLLCLGSSILVALLLLGLRTPLVLTGTSVIQTLIPLINRFFVTTLFCSVFNLIPLPPLIGGHLLYAFSPKLHALAVRQQRWIALLLGAVLALASWSGLLANVRVRLIDLLR